MQALLEAKDAKAQPVFGRRRAVSEAALADAERRLGVVLPLPYRAFLLACGAGEVSGQLRFMDPAELAPFGGDLPWGELIRIGIDHEGNHLAIDPEQGDDPDEPVYYVCHDPFGWANLAPSFEAFLVMLERAGFDYARMIEDTPNFIELAIPGRAPARPWWKFW